MRETPLPGEERANSHRLRRKRLSAHLKSEIADLREQLALDVSYDEESWGESAPQEVRDQFAASALMAEGLHAIRALSRLGFEVSPPVEKKWYECARRIFTTPGVKAILARDTAKFEGELDAVRSALYNIIVDPMTPARDKVGAAAQLGKMIEGWSDGDKKTPAMAVNFLMSLAGGSVGASHNGQEQKALPPGGSDVIEAESFFALDANDEVAVVDDSL